MASQIKRFLLRRGTAAQWTSENPILLEGEQGYETDTGKLKIGDGILSWTSLGYFTPSLGAVTSVSGKTGAVTLVKSDVGLGNVDNTSDINKPISTAVAGALADKADLVGGKLASSQIPGGIDDILEYANFSSFPVTGSKGYLYTDLSDGKVYRWSGSIYVDISNPGTTDNVLEGSSNLYFTNSRADARVAAGITGKMDKSSNLSDVASPSASRNNIGAISNIESITNALIFG